MILFLDSSTLAKRYVQEPGTDVVLDLMGRAEFLSASRLTWVEVTSAITRAARDGSLHNADECTRALDDDFSVVIDIIEVTANVIADARRLVRRHGLRAGDAVQLASLQAATLRYGKPVRFVCSDRRLVATAREEGAETVDPVA